METPGETVVALGYTVELPEDIVVTLGYQSSNQEIL